MTPALGKWDSWYSDLTDEPRPYAATETYRLGADWLAPCSLVADWGCGGGFLTRYIEPERYRGIDGSATPFADVIADLAEYRSEAPGIFMRHVLEHDLRYADILDNALASFTERMALVLFTPLVESTHVAAWNDDPGVPDIAFALSDLTDPMDAAGVLWSAETLATESHYGSETIIYMRKQ
jgi:hypothetical protein